MKRLANLPVLLLALLVTDSFTGCADERPVKIPNSCGNTQCTAEQICQNDTCVPKETPDPNVCDPECPDGQTCQNGECTDLDIEPDPDQPKVCDPACAETQYCQNGECKDISCPNGEMLCKGGCFDLKTDNHNCGECGNACGAKTCTNGECRLVCTSGLTTCGEECIDLNTDARNCGKCGNECAEGQSCRKGSCTVSCAAGETVCGDSCTNLKSDALNCGECGHKCDLQNHETCQNNVCKLTCDAGKDPCGSTCADLDNDLSNCGACGIACDTQNSEVCQNGKCKALCRPTETLCGNACADLKSDKANCGICGHACEAGEKCNDGTCSKDCGSLLDCSDSCIDPQTNDFYCGASDACPDDTAGQKCAEGFSCKAGQCACTDPGAKQCLVNGIAICTDPNTDNAHCGCSPDGAGMNSAALAGTATTKCAAGAFEFTCLDNFRDCDEDPANGCESDITALDNCGACGNICEDQNASQAICLAGSCVYECKENTVLCEGHCRNLSEDSKNCGACGNACGEDAICQNGFCTIPLNKCVEGYVTTKIDDKPIKAYCVRNELELEAVRNNINAGGKYPADNADNAYILMKDLDLGTRDWASIGNSAHAFSGTFLGNGKTISGKLTTYGSNAGLFGFVSNAYFENILLKIDLTAMVHGSQYIGALIGQSNASVIKNCHETGNISDPQNYQFGNPVGMGGLIGALIDSKLLNSSSHSNVTFFNISTSGGLVGSSVNSEIDQCFSECKIRSGHNNEYIDAIGGLTGGLTGGKINNSYAIGDIDLSNHSYAYYQYYIPQQIGGLVGAAKGGNITNTHASVNITAPSINMVGGLVGGCNISLESEITITNSYASGDISCREGCGGLVGSANHLNLYHSHATGKVSSVYTAAGGLLGSGYNSHFEDSYATGDTTAGGYTTYGHVGGLIGYLENSTAENVYATGNVTMTSPDAYSNGGAIGRAVACTLNNIYAKA